MMYIFCTEYHKHRVPSQSYQIISNYHTKVKVERYLKQSARDYKMLISNNEMQKDETEQIYHASRKENKTADYFGRSDALVSLFS